MRQDQPMSRSLPRRAALALMLGLAALAGCESEHDGNLDRVVVPMDKVPPEVLDAAKKHLPNVNFADAWTNHERGKPAAVHSYEVRGRDKQTGKVREVRVGLDGKILEEE
jgi:hypothetical protein